MWGGSLCCNTLGPPVNLWTTGAVDQQFVLSVHSVKFVSVVSPVPSSSDKCMSESDSNTSSASLSL
jgi:hypothetical protein